MKIELEIDDKYKERHIHLFAGLEPVARLCGDGWEFKTGDCSRCGKCCASIDERHPLGTSTGCRHLKVSGNEYLCGLGIFRPYGCAIAEMDTIKECTVRWESN